MNYRQQRRDAAKDHDKRKFSQAINDGRRCRLHSGGSAARRRLKNILSKQPLLEEDWIGKVKALVLRAHRGIAFTSNLAEADQIDYLDFAPAVPDAIFLHQRVGYDRNAVAPSAHELRHPLLSQGEMIAADQIADTQ